MKRNFGKTVAIIFAIAVGFSFNAVSLVWSQEHPAEHPKEHPKEQPTMTVAKAVAVLNPTQGNTAKGVVTFSPEQGGVRVVVKFTGVPKGVHGFHIHEFGDCSAPDGMSAGSHFNPTNVAHAGRDAEKRHMGDMGNVTADEQGNIALDYVDKHIKLAAIIGHGMILHANPDDFTTQPTGNAGGRIACGVIGVGKP